MRSRSAQICETLETRALLATFTVTSLGDPDGSPESQTHLHDPPIGAIDSLRHAIEAANANPGPDVIRFLPDLFANGSANLELDVDEGELEITDSLTIYGPGADTLNVTYFPRCIARELSTFPGQQLLSRCTG